ncbi:MAG: Fic family protein [Actinomycetota bacterium]
MPTSIGRSEFQLPANLAPRVEAAAMSLARVDGYAAVEDLIVFVNWWDIPTIVQAAVSHAQFETIHRFGDGNGRVGRILISWIFRRRGVVGKAVPPISPVIHVAPTII